MSKLLNAIETAKESFHQAQSLGACDTEPRYHFKTEVERYLKGEAYRVLNEDQWELYSLEGSKEATKKINTSMKKIYDEVQKATPKDVKALEDFGIDTVLSIF